LKIRSHNLKRTARAFSLVELLLTLVLILCLGAASVFTFTALYQSSNLDEGADRFQSLVRFAQAEAASTGRKVRLQFVPATAIAKSPDAELRSIRVTWESDLLHAPGVFEEYTNKAWSEEIVNELVGVQKVTTAESVAMNASGIDQPSASSQASSTETADAVELEEEFPSITFYPDGSCDSAEIVLASRNSEDERRLEVRLSGLLGSVSTRTLAAEGEYEDEGGDESNAAAAYDEYNELFESSEPVRNDYATSGFAQ
jgi:Tfp pilus assembly protein FimT